MVGWFPIARRFRLCCVSLVFPATFSTSGGIWEESKESMLKNLLVVVASVLCIKLLSINAFSIQRKSSLSFRLGSMNKSFNEKDISATTSSIFRNLKKAFALLTFSTPNLTLNRRVGAQSAIVAATIGFDNYTTSLIQIDCT